MGRIIFGTESLFKYINHYAGLFSPNQLSHIQQYLSGLICYVGRKTIVQLSYCIMMTTKDEGALRKFLTRSRWNEKALQISRILQMNEVIEDRNNNEAASKVGFFIIDDTVCPKRGKKMKSLGWNHSTTEDRRVWSHCLITSHFLQGKMDYPLLFDVYRPKDTCKKEEFQTKTDLAENQIKTAPLPCGIKAYGLVDSSYMCKRLVEAFQSRGIEVIGRVRGDRLISEEGRIDFSLNKNCSVMRQICDKNLSIIHWTYLSN